MRRIIFFRKCVFVIILLLVAGCFASWDGSRALIASAAEKNEADKMIVKVGYNSTGHYMYGTEEGKSKGGYGYEYLQQLAYYGGWEYEYVPATFPEQLELLKKGEIDLMINVSYTEERAAFIHYSEYPMGEEIYSLCVKPDSDLSVADLSSLSGKTIGATKNTYQVQLLRDWVSKNQIDCRMAETETVEEENALDAFVTVNMYSLGEWVPILELGASEFYFGLSKSNPAFQEKFNEAHRRLLEMNPYYNQELQTRYFGSTMINDQLSPAERDWGKKNPVIRLGYYEHDTHAKDTSAASPDGMVALLEDLVTYMEPHLEQNGMKMECISFGSAQEMEQAMLAGDIHMMFPAYGDLWMAEERGYMLSSVLYAPTMLVFSRDTKNFETMYDKIAVVESDPVQYPYVSDQYPDAELKCYDNVVDCMKAVKDHEVDCTIINSQVAEGILHHNSGLRGLSFFTAYNDKTSGISFGVAPDQSELLSIINKEIRLLPEDLYKNSISEYYLEQNEHILQQNLGKILLAILLVIVLAAILVWRYVRKIHARAEKLKQSNEAIIDMLGIVVEYRSRESGDHIWRVKELTKVFGEYFRRHYPEYGLTEKKVDMIVAASALHDIGKVALPDSILLKPGRLTDEEFDEIKTHTTKGEQFLSSMEGKWDSEYRNIGRDICRYHHERYDGKGYPDGLAGDEIPVAAQIVSIVDVYDALTHKRCYKPAIASEAAIQMIESGECGIFSPKLLAALQATREDLENVLEREKDEME